MDHFNKHLLLIVSLSSLLLLANAVPSTRTIHIVRHDAHAVLVNFCAKTTNPKLCVDTILPTIRGAFDPFQALGAEVEATLTRTQKTIGIIASLLAQQGNNKSLKDSLDTCKEQYDSIVDSIKETKAVLKTKDVSEAKYKFSAVISYQSTCQDEFEGQTFPFAGDSDAVYQLGGNVLDIIADLEKAAGPKKPVPVKSTPSPYDGIIGTIS